jgi:DNA invertase Pin-like site-specific DNA recombinase
MLYWLLQKIDARDVSFTSALYNGNIDFVCCDNPANKLTIQILSVIAENEAEMISVRTKETLAIKKLI